MHIGNMVLSVSSECASVDGEWSSAAQMSEDAGDILQLQVAVTEEGLATPLDSQQDCGEVAGRATFQRALDGLLCGYAPNPFQRHRRSRAARTRPPLGCGEEALRVVGLLKTVKMKGWSTTGARGRPHRVQYNLPANSFWVCRL